MDSDRLIAATRRALPLMTAAQRAEAEQLINELTVASDVRALSRSFETDMQPVCKAIVAALKDGDMEAMKGLRAMLPHLLEEVTADPHLAGALSHQLGRALVAGLTAKPEDAL